VLENGNAARGFHRIEEKILQMEVEAELAKTSAPAAPRYAAQREQIDAQLEALKQKSNPPA
jgi:phage shock protein A